MKRGRRPARGEDRSEDTATDRGRPSGGDAAGEDLDLDLDLDDLAADAVELAPPSGAADAQTYEDVRRLLATMFREAAGLVEAQESVCSMLVEELEHYSWVGIYMVDGDELELASWAGPEETEHTRIPIGEGICGLAAETGETEIVSDVSQDERFIACFPSTRSEIVVPILRDREVIGEIDVDSDYLDAFGERDVRLLEWTAAKLAAMA